MLCRLIRYSYIYTARMNSTLNRSSVLQCFKRGNAIEICNGIMFDFYLEQSDMHVVTRIEIFDAPLFFGAFVTQRLEVILFISF